LNEKTIIRYPTYLELYCRKWGIKSFDPSGELCPKFVWIPFVRRIVPDGQ